MVELESVADYFEGGKIELNGDEVADILRKSKTSERALGELVMLLIRRVGKVEEFAKDYKDWAVNYDHYLQAVIEDDTGFLIGEDVDTVDKFVDKIFDAVKKDEREVIIEAKGETFIRKLGRVYSIGTIKLNIVYEVLGDEHFQIDLEPELLAVKILESEGK